MSSRSIYLLVCTRCTIANPLVQPKNINSSAPNFNMAMTVRSRGEGHISYKKAEVKIKSERTDKN